jgi:hypothetical protein
MIVSELEGEIEAGAESGFEDVFGIGEGDSEALGLKVGDALAAPEAVCVVEGVGEELQPISSIRKLVRKHRDFKCLPPLALEKNWELLRLAGKADGGGVW